MPKPRRDGRVTLCVAMFPEELERWKRYARHNGRLAGPQAYLTLVARAEAWERGQARRAAKADGGAVGAQ